MARRRISKPKPIYELVPGATQGLRRRHWIKFWIERWRSSPRTQKTTYAQHGLYWDIVSYAAETDGCLQMSVDEFACAIGLARRDRRKGFYADLDRLIEVGLIERDGDTLSVPRFMEMQA